MRQNQPIANKTNKPFSFDTLKISALASAKILAYETLTPEDIDACLEVDCYFHKRLGHSIFSDFEQDAIDDALFKRGLEFLDIN